MQNAAGARFASVFATLRYAGHMVVAITTPPSFGFLLSSDYRISLIVGQNMSFMLLLHKEHCGDHE